MNYISRIIETLQAGRVYRIVFLGDSITSTEWVHPNWREILEYVLKEEIQIGDGEETWKPASWGIRCYNAGFNGATTKNLLNILDNEVLSLSPSMVILTGTTNDMDIGLSPITHQDNIKSLIHALEQKVRDVIFCTSPYTGSTKYNARYLKYVEATKNLLPFSKASLLDLFTLYSAFSVDKFYTFIDEEGNSAMGIEPGGIDFAHPNVLGNAYIAKILLKELFNIEFIPEKYIQSLNSGAKYPEY